MQKTVVILIALLSLDLLRGGLVTTLANLDTVEPDVNEYAELNPFPYEMSDLVIDPATGFSLL